MRTDSSGPPFKIVDFDHARVSEFSSIGSDVGQIGAIGFTAPELWQYDSHDERVDYFSAGAILYELFTGHRLFQGIGELMRPGPVWQMEKHRITDEELRDVIGSLLEVDPEDRPDSLRPSVEFFAQRKNRSDIS